VQHVDENAAALKVVLNSEELTLMDQAFPPPASKVALDVV